ncbi:MAG: ABC transporter permease [Gammaproteobacteria bacterium]|nr:ABC transporter permease [Gammaproteobacteria bacterium]MCP5197836.1 ABC transporter permease [Gammaproteobacteria bacterium]
MQLEGSFIRALDTIGALQLHNLSAELEQTGHVIQLTGWREEHRALLDLVRDRLTADGLVESPGRSANVLERLGRQAMHHMHGGFAFLIFIGEAATALGQLLLHPGRFRWRALFANLETAGVHALPIIALLAFMMGIVIAYQGGQQLKFYGANIFIVELVSLTMLRELAPLITAIIVAGRTGSSYTAQIGTMQVTEEVDALRTIGISPMDLLVLPKLLALTVALPLLTVFADALSVFGGMVVAQVMLDVKFQDFLDRFPQAVSLTSFLLGVGKAPVFAAIIALVGCYQGFQVRGGADSVGQQTTISVVQAIFLVIAADALFSVLLGGVGL